MVLIIKNCVVIDDVWQVVCVVEDGVLFVVDVLLVGKVLVLFVLWQVECVVFVVVKMKDEFGVWFVLDSELVDFVVDFGVILLIVVDFLCFVDGCGYSIVCLLCECYGWIGELCVIGDVLCDQLLYMLCCGFDVFVVCVDKDIYDVLNVFIEFMQCYQGVFDELVLLFCCCEVVFDVKVSV